MVQWLQRQERHSGDKVWVGLCKGQAFCWQIRGNARSESALNLRATYPTTTTTPAPGREGQFFRSGTVLGPSGLWSEWLLPSSESATSSPGNKFHEIGNGGFPNCGV